jgi:hypothetical protein
VIIKYQEGSYSEAGQESFVIAMLEEKYRGYYLEIGSAHATLNSNTYLLETKYKWKGVGIELDAERVLDYRAGRSNPCVEADATTFNYTQYFEDNGFPNQIDYLQLDIEPPQATLNALKALPLDTYRFSTITYEHDYYNSPHYFELKREAQHILRSYGYSQVADNVLSRTGEPFEDWWIDPTAISITLVL